MLTPDIHQEQPFLHEQEFASSTATSPESTTPPPAAGHDESQCPTKTLTANPLPSKTGRPFALDDVKRAEICALLTAGISLRKAAQFVDCDPQTIRREAHRNDDFRSQLTKAKSGAKVEPLLTLRAAAQNDWRAALSWMKCVDPERHARQDANTITKLEANHFVDDLVESIGKAVSIPDDRQNLFELIAGAMPPAMRRRWEASARDRAMTRVTQDVQNRKSARELKEMYEQFDRDFRRRKLLEQIGDYLTPELYEALRKNEDLLDPSEFFARRGGWSKDTDPKKDGSNLPAHLKFKPGTVGSTRYGPELYHDDWKKYGWVPPDGSTNSGQPDKNASPGDDFAPTKEDIASPRRNTDHFAPPPAANSPPANDLQLPNEAKPTV